MKISLITPAQKATRTGNRTTAYRWARILRSLGHRVQVATHYDETPADLMIALHAWRSADSIRAYRARYPSGRSSSGLPAPTSIVFSAATRK